MTTWKTFEQSVDNAEQIYQTLTHDGVDDDDDDDKKV